MGGIGSTGTCPSDFTGALHMLSSLPNSPCSDHLGNKLCQLQIKVLQMKKIPQAFTVNYSPGKSGILAAANVCLSNYVPEYAILLRS